VDVLVVRCERCGTEREFEFDISSFFGKVDPLSFKKVLLDADRAWQMYVAYQCPMEMVLKYLSEFARNGDFSAIEYVAETAHHFLLNQKKTP
jgi:hypothetical protein